MIKEFEKFIKAKASNSEATEKAYRFSIENFLNDLHLDTLEKIDNLTPMDYLDYQEFLLTKPLAKSSVNSHFRNISAFVCWLKQMRVIKNIPAITEIDKLKLPKTEIFTLTPDEVKSIIDHSKQLGKKLMLVMLFQLGLRRSEIVNIEVTDIFDNKITVHGKGDKERTLDLSNDIIYLLDKYLKERKVDSKYLFYSIMDGGQLSPECVGLRVKGAAEKAGISPDRLAEITAHTCRKTCATQLLDDGVSLDVVQEVLGHASITTTRSIYAKTSKKNIRTALINQKSLL